MNKIYAVITNDSRIDLDVELFADKFEAIDRAGKIAVENSRHSFAAENKLDGTDGWIFRYNYDNEGAYIAVIERVVK